MKINKDNINTSSRDELKDKVANLKKLQQARIARQEEHKRLLEQKAQASEKPDILSKYSEFFSVSDSESMSTSESLSDSSSEELTTSEHVSEELNSEVVEPAKPLTAVEKLKARLANKNADTIEYTEPGSVAIAPVVDQTTQPIEPVVDQTTQPIEPVVEQTTQPIEPVVEQTTQPIEPVIEQTTQPIEPVVEQTTQPIEPVVEPTTQPIAPVVEPTTQPIEPVVEQTTQPIEPVVEQTTQPIEPVVEQTTQPIAPLNVTNELSDTQYNAPAIVIPEDPNNIDDSKLSDTVKWYKRKSVIISSAVGLIAVAILGAFVASRTSNSSTNNNNPSTSISTKKSSSTSSSSKSLSYEDALKEKLDKEASTSKTEHKVDISNVGGGYLLGMVTYYPNDASKSYIDYSLTKPEHSVDVVKDETSEKIETELKSKLPTINDTIKVKDKDKLTMETYKLDDGTYSTILLYNKKPFAYVTSDAELNMVNHVTTYYVSDVAAS